MGDLVERLRTTKLLSNRNQMALQAEAADEIARLREALDRQCDTVAFVLNNATLPDQWYCKFSNELERNRALIQHKETQG